MSIIDTINIDMDGVLYDFTGQMAVMDGFDYAGRWFEYVQDQNLSLHEYIVSKFDEYAPNGLFLNGNLCTGAIELLFHVDKLRTKHGLKVNILGALPHNKPYANIIKEHKLSFIKRLDLNYYFDDIILVDGSKSKLKYANKNSILIDDYPATKSRYDKIGGNMILHKNTKNTINELNKYSFK